MKYVFYDVYGVKEKLSVKCFHFALLLCMYMIMSGSCQTILNISNSHGPLEVLSLSFNSSTKIHVYSLLLPMEWLEHYVSSMLPEEWRVVYNYHHTIASSHSNHGQTQFMVYFQLSLSFKINW